jgi:hypothetical protein
MKKRDFLPSFYENTVFFFGYFNTSLLSVKVSKKLIKKKVFGGVLIVRILMGPSGNFVVYLSSQWKLSRLFRHFSSYSRIFSYACPSGNF